MRVHAAPGLDIAYERIGDGPPLVLVHGAGDDARIWRPQLGALAADFTVIAWDEPGSGRSSDLPAGFGLPDYALCLAAVIDDAALGPAHVAGLSWGGTVVLELHRHRPDVFATMILADTYAGWKGSLPEEEVCARVDQARRALDGPATDPGQAFPGMFAGEPPEAARALLRELAAGVRPSSLRTQLAIMAEADLRDVLPSIETPVLLLWGALDARSPVGVARQFQAAIPHAELVLIDGCGHLSNLDRPDVFNATVRRFCRSHPPSAR